MGRCDTAATSLLLISCLWGFIVNDLFICMIRLTTLLAETRQDSVAREMASNAIKQLKAFRRYAAVEEPEDFEDDYEMYDEAAEDAAESSYPFETKDGSKNVSVDTIIVVRGDKRYKKGDYEGGALGKKDIARGYNVRGSVAGAGDGVMELILVMNRSTFDNLEPRLSEIYYSLISVARHELEHIFQSSKSFKTSGREQDRTRDVDPSFSKRKGQKHYRLLPTEMEADAKAINLLKKKKRIPLEQAARDYYSAISQVHKGDVDSLVKAIMQYAKRFNFG